MKKIFCIFVVFCFWCLFSCAVAPVETESPVIKENPVKLDPVPVKETPVVQKQSAPAGKNSDVMYAEEIPPQAIEGYWIYIKSCDGSKDYLGFFLDEPVFCAFDPEGDRKSPFIYIECDVEMVKGGMALKGKNGGMEKIGDAQEIKDCAKKNGGLFVRTSDTNWFASTTPPLYCLDPKTKDVVECPRFDNVPEKEYFITIRVDRETGEVFWEKEDGSLESMGTYPSIKDK